MVLQGGVLSPHMIGSVLVLLQTLREWGAFGVDVVGILSYYHI